MPCSLSEYAGRLNKFEEFASTLQARDYKGFGNQQSNGVITLLHMKKNRNE